MSMSQSEYEQQAYLEDLELGVKEPGIKIEPTCIACRIENHAMCLQSPNCSCGCVHPKPRFFSREQLRIIESLERQAIEEGIEP